MPAVKMRVHVDEGRPEMTALERHPEDTRRPSALGKETRNDGPLDQKVEPERPLGIDRRTRRRVSDQFGGNPRPCQKIAPALLRQDGGKFGLHR